jgi:hypothetical protein
MTLARTVTESRRTIPREWQISNPNPPYSPSGTPPKLVSPFPFFNSYRAFIRGVLANYDQQLSLDTIPSEAATFIKDAFAEQLPTTIFHELMVRQFLQACQTVFIVLVSQPKMARAAILHNELCVASALIRDRQLSSEMLNHCDMLRAEVLDVYQGTFAGTITTKYWGKTRGVEEVVSQLLRGELQLFRRLNDYSFKMLSAAMVHRAIETAPPSAIPVLMKFAEDNGIDLE